MFFGFFKMESAITEQKHLPLSNRPGLNLEQWESYLLPAEVEWTNSFGPTPELRSYCY